MACNLYTLGGLGNGCKEQSFGGIKQIWIALSDDVASMNVDSETHQVTPVMVSGKKFKPYTFLKNTGALTSTLTVNENGANYFTNEVSIKFFKLETRKRQEIMHILLSSCVVLVQDANGCVWLLGKDMPVEASAATAQTGTAFSDANDYELTLQDTSYELPYEVPAVALSSICDELPSDNNGGGSDDNGGGGEDSGDTTGTTYTISVEKVGAGAGTSSVSGAGSYAAGATVTLSASAGNNYEFAGWYSSTQVGSSQDQLSIENPYTFTASESKTIYANFTESGLIG